MILDDDPFNIYLNGIIEDALLLAQQKDPNLYINVIEEFEKEIGRKIGTASPEEIALCDSILDD